MVVDQDKFHGCPHTHTYFKTGYELHREGYLCDLNDILRKRIGLKGEYGGYYRIPPTYTCIHCGISWAV